MKTLRKWSRILHRDIGYFFIGTTIIYALSGIALNHMSDWNPNYSVEVKTFHSELPLDKSDQIRSHIDLLLEEIDHKENYKQHYYPDPGTLKIFLRGGSSVLIDVASGNGRAEFLKRRVVFYESNYLHYNPNRIWTWFSDVFAAALLLFAVTSFFMVKGKKGITGRGGLYTLLGILLPLLFLWIYM